MNMGLVAAIAVRGHLDQNSSSRVTILPHWQLRSEAVAFGNNKCAFQGRSMAGASMIGRKFAQMAVFAWFFVLAATLPGLSSAASAQNRVAIVIANSAYTHASFLPNPVSDGRLMARSLKSAGFNSVTLLENQDRQGMERALRDFSAQAEKASVALVYFAGHGIEFKGENYLIPVDARFLTDRDLEVEAVKLSTVMSLSEGASRLRIIVLDACRTPPPVRRSIATRAVGGGLVPIEPEGESLVVYSAKAGTPALDGTGANSPFATALAKRITQPGVEIQQVMRYVRDDVLKATGKVQEPFVYGSLSAEQFYFLDAPKLAGGSADLESETWYLCRDASGKGPCDSYLKSYPKGKFAGLARGKIADLGTATALPSFNGGAGAGGSSFAASGQQPAQPPSAMELVQLLGVNVQPSADGSAVVRSVSSKGMAFGQLFAGDIITSVNSAALQRSRSISDQMGGAMESGYLKLLVKRGPSTTVVVLRKPK
jgi:Caspase domain